MQTASAAFDPPPPNGYQPLSEAEIYAIKRQYLALLPTHQIIDACLTFEAHAPLHVKSSVWPYDIRTAIASMLAQRAQTCAQSPARSSPEQTSQAQSSTAGAPSVSQPPPGPHYPHQPYYPPAYPHAPCHNAPFTYPPLYPVSHPPPFTNTPLVNPSHPAPEPPPTLNNVDDLPSYEEMIVEALLDSDEPEGCAPKKLFSWMATHYPLQMNFRPSASQALQKAYKRGRLDKGSNGKYRLNENWEGGNTSKRTTRRPQTLAQTTLPNPQPPSSPFTYSPLGPHGASNPQACLPPGHSPGCGGYPFGYPYPGASGSTQPSAACDSLRTASLKQAVGPVDHETGEGSDAWEAAQNILKAINFGQLFQISNEENKAVVPSPPTLSIPQRASADESDRPTVASTTVFTGEPASSHLEGIGKMVELNAEQRAALQAQLALLAAQLAELANVREEGLSHNLEVPQQTTATGPCTPQVLGTPEEEGGKEDTSEVLVPTTSLMAQVKCVHDR